MYTKAADLLRIVNSRTYITRFNPTSSEFLPRITTSHQILSRKAIKELYRRIPLTGIPHRRLGKQPILRRDQKLWKHPFRHAAPPRHPPTPLDCLFHLFSRAEPPHQFKTSVNLPTLPKTLTRSSLTQHHWVGIRTQYQSPKSCLLTHQIPWILPLRRVRLRVVALSPTVARPPSTR